MTKKWMVLFLILLGLLVAPINAQNPTITLKVMTFNVWLGGEIVNFDKVIEAIQKSEADVVGLQEATGNTRRIAEALGWSFANERLQIISHFPLIDPPNGNGVYLFVQPYAGGVVAIANVHLPSSPYGPEALRDGASVAEVITLENDTRLPAIAQQLEILPQLVNDGIPVFLTGDFNTPSHLDWQADMVGVRDVVTEPINWSVSVALETVSFRDTYREIHPDVTQKFGFTWTPGYPHPFIRENETIDRIDWVLASGDSRTINSQIVGEIGNSDVDIAINPYPSDHRGVVSTFEVTPATPPVYIAVEQRSVRVGQRILVRFHTPAQGDELVAIQDGDAIIMAQTTSESAVDGASFFGTGTLTPKQYEAVLLDGQGGVLSRSAFWVLATDAVPQLSPEKTQYTLGEPIVVQWKNTPANRWDWIGIYQKGETNLENYLSYVYTEASVDGTFTFTPEDYGDIFVVGDYELRLMLDDGYAVLASTAFSIAP
jgi:exonuclease III